MDHSTKALIGFSVVALWVFSLRGRDNERGYYSGLDSVPNQQMRDNFIAVSREFDLPVGLLVEICRKESGFNVNVPDGPRYGEVGVMQMIPGTRDLVGATDADLRVPSSAIYFAGKYLSMLTKYSAIGTDWFKVAQAYNGGPGHLTNPAKNGGPSIAATLYATRVYSLPSSDTHYFDIG